MKTGVLVAALLSLIPTIMLAGEAPTSRRGELWALVLHSETGVGLEGIPVYVSSTSTDEAKKPIRVETRKDGFAIVTGLAPGEYVAWVDYNNHQSELAAFTIDQSLLAKVAILFNPDID